MMKSVKFGNKTALEIIDTDLKKHVKDFLSEKAKTRPLDKNYRFLNHGALSHLGKFPHLVALSTFGKKFLIVLVQIEDKHQTIFVDRKKEMMIFMPMGFDKSLYQGTILDGELIKNNDGHWIYFINEILLFKGKSVFQKPLQERIEIVSNILTNEFKPNKLDFCSLEMKQYFPLKYINDLSTSYRLRLNYKCSGLYFKNEIRNEKPLLYIFPENRTPLTESNTVSNDNSHGHSSNMFSNGGGNKHNSVNSAKLKVLDDNILDSIQNTIDKHVFLLKKMDYPDVYELYAKKSKETVKIGIAGISSLDVSQKVAKMIKDFSENDEIKVECQYIPRFKKWEPIKLSNEDVYQIETN